MSYRTEVLELVQDSKRSLVMKNYAAALSSLNLATDLMVGKPKFQIRRTVAAFALTVVCGIGLYFAMIGMVQTARLYGTEYTAVYDDGELVGYLYTTKQLFTNESIARMQSK